MKRRLNLNECSEFRAVVFDIKAAMLVFVDIGVKPTNGYVMDSDICVVSSSKPYFVSIIEIDNVQLLLLVCIIFSLIYLESLDNQIITLWLRDFENLMSLLVVNEVIL